MIYCYISFYCILLYILKNYSSTGITGSNNEYISTLTNAKNEFIHNWLEFYISNYHFSQRIRSNEININQEDTPIQTYIQEFDTIDLGIHPIISEKSNEQNSGPFKQIHEVGESDFENMTTHPYEKFTTRKFNVPGFEGNDNSQKNNPEINDLAFKLDRTLIQKFIRSRNSYINHTFQTHSPSYESYLFLYMMVFSVSKDQYSCNLADINKFPLENRAYIIKEALNLNDTSIADLIYFIKQFNDEFAASKSIESTFKIYNFSSDCSRIQISQSAIEEYFVTTNDKITVGNLVSKVKNFCPMVGKFMSSYQTYLRIIYPLDLSVRFQKLGIRLADMNDPIHKSKTKISDFCTEIIMIPNIAKFIRNNTLAIDSISCNVRRLFNVKDTKDIDYMNGYNILNSLYMTSSSTTHISFASTHHQNPSVSNSSNPKLPDKIPTPLTTEKHSSTLTIPPIIKTSSFTKDNANASSGKSKKLSPLEIGVICTGIVAFVVIIISVTCFIHMRRALRTQIY